MKGRGALSNPAPRYLRTRKQREDDGWFQEPEQDRIATELLVDATREIIARNDSPDIPFDQSINPYRGCEHGCIFCYARPTHAYLDLSPGIDFETRLVYKPDAAALLREALSRPGYRCRQIMLGTNTDPYQPVERELRITRSVLEVLAETHHPVGITTRSTLVLRDIDLLAPMAREGLVSVFLSVTTFDAQIKRSLEPRSASAPARMQVMRELSNAGIPVGVIAAPMIPAVNDAELETILERSAAHGATRAAYVLLRLPLEVAPLFREWLQQHLPDRAAHVMSLVQGARGGKDNDAGFGRRMKGQGAWAALLRDRFHLAARRLGLDTHRDQQFDVSRFRPPGRGGQMALSW